MAKTSFGEFFVLGGPGTIPASVETKNNDTPAGFMVGLCGFTIMSAFWAYGKLVFTDNQ